MYCSYRTEIKPGNRQIPVFVEVLELALHDDIYLVKGIRDSKGEAGEP
jgi:hypothetical protein